MKREIILYVIMASVLSLCFQLQAQPLAAGRDKFLGNVHSGTPPGHWDNYWNQVTPENAGKWGSAEGSRDNFNWGGADAAYSFAKQRGIPFKWHTLIWGQQQPGWINALSPAEQLKEIEEWYAAVAQRYPAMDYIDVVNEPLRTHNPPDGRNNRANYKDALGGDGVTGWDWVIKAFEMAREYMPGAKLLLNDYGIINDNNATTSYLQVINLLKERGLIDGIGVQGHRFELMNAPSNTLKNNLDRLAATGIPVNMSEFDLGPAGNVQPNEALQLAEYQRIFPLLWEHPGLEGITLWGYVQGSMWQTNCFLIYSNGTETAALKWLRQYLTQQGSFRSVQSGEWKSPSTWEMYDGSQWINPAAEAPSSNGAFIQISRGHTVTVTGTISADQLAIAAGATLVIHSGASLFISDGTGVDLSVSGDIINSGVITSDNTAELRFHNGSAYEHAQDGGSVPAAIWSSGSTVEFRDIVNNAPANSNQNFGNVLWNCPGQTSNLNFGWNGNTISGNITIQNTGSNRFYMCGPTADAPVEVTIEGNIVQTGGEFSTNGTSNGNTSVTINHNGNINITGGNFSISRGSQGGSGTTVWNLNGNFTMRNATTQNSNEQGARFVFTGAEPHTLTLGAGNTLMALPIQVSSGATLNLGTSILQGSGIFTLNEGATVETGHPEGIDGNLKNTGTITISAGASFGYSGATAQVTGSLLPDKVGNLIMNNSAGVTLTKAVTVNGMLDIKQHGLSLGGNALIFGEEGTLSYSGTAPLTTSDVEFPSQGGPKNLRIASNNVTLHQSRTITGDLTLEGRLRLEDNDLSIASAITTEPTRFVVTNGAGSLKISSVGSTESHFPVGTTAYYAPVWVTNTGAADEVGVTVIADSEPAPKGGRIRAKWILSETIEGGGDYTLKFGWAPSLEDAAFRRDREGNAGIFSLGADTTEAGEGNYTHQFETQPYTVSRGGITSLGSFAVGKFGEITVGVKDIESASARPEAFSLSQNYPNPFNPATTLWFTIGARQFVTLKVYDILGNQVATLVNEEKEPGRHNVSFDAAGLASGIYMYKLRAGEFTDVKKMMVLK